MLQLCRTPLGSPVLPEVNNTIAGWSGSTGDTEERSGSARFTKHSWKSTASVSEASPYTTR